MENIENFYENYLRNNIKAVFIQLVPKGDRELIMSTNPRSQNLQVAPRLVMEAYDWVIIVN